MTWIRLSQGTSAIPPIYQHTLTSSSLRTLCSLRPIGSLPSARWPPRPGAVPLPSRGAPTWRQAHALISPAMLGIRTGRASAGRTLPSRCTWVDLVWWSCDCHEIFGGGGRTIPWLPVIDKLPFSLTPISPRKTQIIWTNAPSLLGLQSLAIHNFSNGIR